MHDDFSDAEQTDDQRELKERNRRLDREHNDTARDNFERARDRRSDYIEMDNRIRRIAGREVRESINMTVFGGLFILAVERGSWLSAAAVAAVGGFLFWENARNKRKDPKYLIGEIDELAENTIAHERIVEFEALGQIWVRAKPGDVVTGKIFEDPYWRTVNERVRHYASISHSERIVDNARARAQSLPHRQFRLAELKFKNLDCELPYWAEITPEYLAKKGVTKLKRGKLCGSEYSV